MPNLLNIKPILSLKQNTLKVMQIEFVLQGANIEVRVGTRCYQVLHNLTSTDSEGLLNSGRKNTEGNSSRAETANSSSLSST